MDTNTATVTAHAFAHPTVSVPEMCRCGAAFVDGYHLEVVKVAHLRAHGITWDAIVADLTAGQLATIIEGTLRLGSDNTENLAAWNAAITEEQNR